MYGTLLKTANALQTTPFLVRTFVKIGGFHRLTQFEDGLLPTTDEQQLFTWCVSPISDKTFFPQKAQERRNTPRNPDHSPHNRTARSRVQASAGAFPIPRRLRRLDKQGSFCSKRTRDGLFSRYPRRARRTQRYRTTSSRRHRTSTRRRQSRKVVA